MTRFPFLSRIFRFRSRRSASQKTANPETVGLSRQQHCSSSEPTQAHPAVIASDPATPYYDHGTGHQSSPPPESTVPIRVVSCAACATSTAQPRSVSTVPVPLPVSITPAIPSPRIVQSPLTATSFPARISQTITDPAETRRSIYVSPTVPFLPPDRHDVRPHAYRDGPLQVPPSESQWVAPTQIWSEHRPRPQNLRPAVNGSPQLPPTHARRRVTFQAAPRTRTHVWAETPPEIYHPSEESLASSCSTLVPNTYFRTTPGAQAVPAPDMAVGSPETKSSTVVAAETTMAERKLLTSCDSENESKNDTLAPLPLQSSETLPPNRIRGSEKARRYASLFTGTPQHHHQAERGAKVSRFSLPSPHARNAGRTSFLPFSPSPGTGSGAGSATKRAKRQSRWSKEVNKPETQDMLRMMALTGLSM